MENFDFLNPQGANTSSDDDQFLSSLLAHANMPIQHSPRATAAPAAAAGGMGIFSTPRANAPPRPPGLSPGIRVPLSTAASVVTCTGTISKNIFGSLSTAVTTVPTASTYQSVAGAAGGTNTSTASSSVSALQAQLLAQQQMQNVSLPSATNPQLGSLASGAYVPPPYFMPFGAQSQSTAFGSLGTAPTFTFGMPSATYQPGSIFGGSGGINQPSAAAPPGAGLGGTGGIIQPPPVQAPPGNLVSPFGQFFNDMTPTLHTEQAILAGGDIINWYNYRPSTELEMLLTKQQLLQSGINYPNVHNDVKQRLSIELTAMSANQWGSAVGRFATMLQDKTDLATKLDQSILRQSMKVLVEPPVLGVNTFSGSAVKSLQTGLQRKRLCGDQSDPLDFSCVLQTVKNTIEQFGLNRSSAFLISKEAFGGMLAHFLDSCSVAGMPFETFWCGIQGTLSSTRSPAAILNLINRLKSVRPNYLMQTLNSIFQLHRLHSNITHAGEDESFRSIRSSYFELIQSHFPAYHAMIRQEDQLNLKLLRREAERLQRLGLDPMQSLRVYHPVLSLQQVILYCVGSEINKQSSHTAQNQRRPQHPPGGGFDAFGRMRNPVMEADVEVETASTRANSPEVETFEEESDLAPISSDEQSLLEHYNALHEELNHLENLAVEKKFRSFPFHKKDNAKMPTNNEDRKCFHCNSPSHLVAQCPDKPKKRKSFQKPRFNTAPKPEAAAADLAAGDLTLQDLTLNDLTLT